MELMKQFETQSRQSIWPFLRQFVEQDHVFVRECVFLRDAFKHNGVYLYFADGEVEIVVVDTMVEHNYEVIDEESLDGEQPVWFSESDHRVSPIYTLRQVMKLAHTACQKSRFKVPVIRGLLLTFSNLINYDDMEDYMVHLRVQTIGNLRPQDAPIQLPNSDPAVQEGRDETLTGRQLMKLMEEQFDAQQCELEKVSEEWIPLSAEELDMASILKLKHKLEEVEGQVPATDTDKAWWKDEDDLQMNLFSDDFLAELDAGLTAAQQRREEMERIQNEVEEHEPDINDDWNPFDDDPFNEEPYDEEVVFMKHFDEQIERVQEDLNEQYPGALGNCNIPARVEIRKPTYHPGEDFDKLVGCQEVRKQMEALSMLTRYNQRLQELVPTSKPHQMTLHAIFTGNPGTGKSTLCRLYGSLLREAGALKWGHVVVCDRSTFVGTHWGDEEKMVRSLFQLARGGVLLIDEAYQLMGNDHPNDPGRLVLPLMMNMLADPAWKDLAVVLSGYAEPMDRLIAQTLGLDSRFPNRFHFKDFTSAELEEIARRRIAEHGYHFAQDAWAKFSWYLREAHEQCDEQWSNARFVANWLERIYLCHAQRCETDDIKDPGLLCTLTKEDVCQPIKDL